MTHTHSLFNEPTVKRQERGDGSQDSVPPTLTTLYQQMKGRGTKTHPILDLVSTSPSVKAEGAKRKARVE